MPDVAIYGFGTPDAEYLKMKAVWDACEVAGIDPPSAVVTYFDGYPPEHAGIQVTVPFTESSGDDCEYHDITVAMIPANVHTIRVRVDY